MRGRERERERERELDGASYQKRESDHGKLPVKHAEMTLLRISNIGGAGGGSLMPLLDEFRCDARENVKIIKRTLRRGRGYKTNDAIARLAQLVRHTRSDTARVASSRERGAGGKDHYALSLSLFRLFISVKSGVRARTFARPIRRRDGSPEISIVKVLRLLLFGTLNSPIRHFADKCDSSGRSSPLTGVRRSLVEPRDSMT